MKQSDFVRWLRQQGVIIKHGTNHLKLYHNGAYTTLTRHPSQEIGSKTEAAVKKKLKLN
ncbi:MAG: mRNA interferase [Neisseriaceae bacterium]|nr:mRNA interferase [Neisseriaceae bacterium]